MRLPMVHYGWHTWGWGEWLAMILVLLLFWGVVVAVIVALFNYGRSRHFPLPPPPGASPGGEAGGRAMPEAQSGGAPAGGPAAGSVGGPAAGSVGGPGGGSAMEILDQRFARGEIDADEYTKRRDLLRSGS